MEAIRRRGLRVSEVTRMLGVSSSFLYRQIALGAIPVVRLGSRRGGIRIRPEDIESYLKKRLV